MGPSPRLLRAVDAERTTLERQRAQLAREAAALRASLARIEAGIADIDALCARLDGLAPRDERPGREGVVRDEGVGGLDDGVSGRGEDLRRRGDDAGRRGDDRRRRGVDVRGAGDGRREKVGGPGDGRREKVGGPGDGRREKVGGPGDGRRGRGEDVRVRGVDVAERGQRRGGPGDGAGGDVAARHVAAGDDGRVLRGPAIRTTAVALLVASGRDALHYRAWFELLTQAGYDVAGKDPLAVFLTQISRSPAVRKGARPGEYVLDRTARATLQQRLQDLNRELATLPQRTSDLTELRTRRAQLTHEITKTEKALEELQPAA